MTIANVHARQLGRIVQERESCAFGVPREQCHVGCGRACRRAADPADVQAARRAAFEAAPFVCNPRLAFNALESECCTCVGSCDWRSDGICRGLPECCGGCDRGPGHRPCSSL